MLDWLENFIKSGVEEGRFSEKQAHQDLQIALWYAFACLNLDDYIHYYRAAEWMKDSEKNATAALPVLPVFCGVDVLRQAGRSTGICGAGRSGGAGLPLDLAPSGQARAHFGDKSGALDAVKQGLNWNREIMSS